MDRYARHTYSLSRFVVWIRLWFTFHPRTSPQLTGVWILDLIVRKVPPNFWRIMLHMSSYLSIRTVAFYGICVFSKSHSMNKFVNAKLINLPSDSRFPTLCPNYSLPNLFTFELCQMARKNAYVKSAVWFDSEFRWQNFRMLRAPASMFFDSNTILKH